ncbi:beta strand repeat-containing protein, partial [Muriicola sp. Z0-33]|uniref:beta strand repeat-containing protein n=1 Tax=Muriicola sp. Z0-33 TaxID=2816957 RepID=UPI0022377664
NIETIDTNASANPYDNTASGLTATNVQAAIDELNTGSTDNQNISGSGLAGNNLTIGIENGSNEVVDLSTLAESVIAGTGAITVTDDGNGNYTVNSTDPDEDLTNELTLIGSGAPVIVPGNSGVTYVDNVAGQLYIWDGATWNAVGGNASPDLDGDPTNEQNTAFAVNGANLEITDSGGTLAVPIASLGTDDQNIESLAVDTGTNVLTVGIEDGTSQNVDLSHLDDAGTDDQNLTLAGTDLSIEDGNTVDLSGFVSTDDQNIESLAVDTGTNVLTVGIEDGSSQNVDLSHLDDAGTDDQNLTGASLSGANVLQIDIENGASTTVDLSALDDAGTDDQNLTLAGTDLSIEDGNTVDLSGFVSTDDQNIESLAVDTGTNVLTVGIEDGSSQTVDLSHLDDAGTDDQNLTGASLSGANVLQIDIENGASTTVDLSALDDAGTDDQNLTLAGTDLSIEDGNTVDLSGFVSTDDQNIESLAVDTGTNVLTVGIEDGTSQNVDLSHLDDAGTDDQNLTLAGTDLSIEDGNTVDLSGFVSTDDQILSTTGAAGNISIEDGNTLNLNVDDADADATNEYNTGVAMVAGSLVVTDGGGPLSDNLISTDLNNDITAGTDGAIYLNVASVTISETITNMTDAGNGLVTYVNENGVTQTVAKANITDNGDGTYTFTNNDGTDVLLDTRANSNPYNNGTSGLTATDVQAAIDELVTGSTDDQNIESLAVDTGTNILTVGIEDGTSQTVDLSHLDDAGTDDQNLTGASLSGANVLQIDIENGASTTVDLSALDDAGTDDQNLTLAGTDLSIEDGNTVDLSGFVSTDDQNIAGSGLSGTDLTIGIENGSNQVVDLSSLVGTDDQNLTLAGTDLSIEDGNTVDLSGFVSTDDQNIESLAVDTGTNVLTVGIEDGTSQTVDLSHLDDAGTDDQNLTLAANTLSIEDGNNV